jgi:hypothetical protein
VAVNISRFISFTSTPCAQKGIGMLCLLITDAHL